MKENNKNSDSKKTFEQPAPTSVVNSSGGTSKSFRHQSDIEFFYRFVHENDLRKEAIDIFRQVRARKRDVLAQKYKKHQTQ